MNCAIIATIATIATKLSGYIVPPIGTQLGYLLHYNKNVAKLKEGVEDLKDKRVRVEGLIDVAKRNGEVIEIDVKSWLTKVSKIIEDVEKLLENEAGEKKNCYKVWCPNFWSSYQRSRKAKKKASTITTFLRDSEISTVSRPAPHPGILSPTFTTFESRIPVMEEIMAVLKDDKIQMIGIYGLGGVGKTTIVKDIFARAKREKLFEEVVMAVVSQTPRIKDIQGQIADLLDLKLSEETELGRAGRLCERLNGKRVLVILDDVWASLDLSSVGIPSCNACKGCKIMLTSRNQDVCSEMKTQKDFFINVLRQPEAWTLFREIVGDVVDSPDLHPIATEVAEACGGLPIAIITVANSLKKKTIHGWKDALQLLKASASRNIKGMHAKVYANIELSYDSLESEEAKSCFLLCCLLPADKDILIEILVRYAVGLRLFENVNTFEDERNRAHSLISDLKASGLLSDSKYEGHVQMHDVIRDVGLFIASKGKHIFMVKADNELKKWRPKKDKLEPYNGISLMFNDTNDLPQSLECPKLQLLSLQANHNYLGNIRIPEAFFKGMTELNVLDMSRILSPPLFGFTMKLRTLHLYRCSLGNVSILGELKSLEILSFSNSSITELPREIRELTHLKMLDLDRCHELKVIQPGVISSLSQLEELYIGDSPVQWEIEENGSERSNASLVELESLSRLIILDIHIPDVKLLGKDYFFQNLIRFRLSIDSYFDAVPSYLFSATLRLKFDMAIPLGYGLQNLMRRAEKLCLDEVKGLKTVLYELDSKGFKLLKSLKVQSCNDVENIIDTSKLYKHIAFPCLEKLFVKGLPNLKSICCYGQLPAGSFGKLSVLEVSNCAVLGVVFDLTQILIEEGHSLLLSQLRELRLTQLLTLKHMLKGPTGRVSLQNLRVLEVKHCDKLENLFSPFMARALVQLHLLEIEGCKMLKEIFRNEKGEGGEIIDEIKLPHLNSLKLRGLPNIRSFWPLVKNFALEGNPYISMLQSLFNRKVAFRNLEVLELRFMDNLKEIWQSELPSASYNKLRVLVVIGCHKLSAIAQTNLLQMLQNLDLLEVRGCNSLTEVFEIKGHNADFSLSQLTELKLIDLPKLKHIWSNDFQGIPSLQNLRILEVRNCGCQNSLFSFSVGRSFEKLKEMSIINCMSLEEIIAEAKGDEVAVNEIVFPQMSFLVLENLPELTSFSRKSCTFEWSSLRKLKIAGCHKMKSFTPNELDLTVSRHLFNDKVLFPGLEELDLGYMENTREIWDKQIPFLSFSKLLELQVVCFDKLLAVGTSNLLRKLQYLETLTIENCRSLEEVFDTGGLDIGEGYAKPLSRLRDLRLQNLPMLMHLWNMDSNVYMGFQSLNCLTIYRCDRLKNIFSPSIAGTLKELISLVIKNCKMLEGIITEGKKGEVIKIVFPKLVSLELKKLPNLTTFCQGSYTLEWPSLESLRLRKCPQIDKLTANKMGITNSGLEETLSEGHPDIQIQYLFDEKVVRCLKFFLEVFGSSALYKNAQGTTLNKKKSVLVGTTTS
ncbi:hypothetical protein F0562_033494 [Nyssa sinensis]|uniref:Uncharacterized protein n=1 Tax=Nyssa sinensis TaxID=561372 RepID=A0A5J5AFM6_9ASTE|nr:hypothetical protein F0562_033494 [Nyssa sinensis]